VDVDSHASMSGDEAAVCERPFAVRAQRVLEAKRHCERSEYEALSGRIAADCMAL